MISIVKLNRNGVLSTFYGPMFISREVVLSFDTHTMNQKNENGVLIDERGRTRDERESEHPPSPVNTRAACISRNIVLVLRAYFERKCTGLLEDGFTSPFHSHT